MLGALEVHEGRGRLDLGLRKTRLLFAALAVRAGAPVSADSLAESLWPGGPPKKWEAALQSHVSRLRSALEPGRSSRDAKGRIETRGSAYLLNVDDDEIDARRFERVAADGRAALARGELERAASLLTQALDEWRGPFLADFAREPFVDAESRRLEELKLVTTEHRVDADLALGRHASIVAELEGLVDAHPLRERLWELLLVALYRSGRQADALQRYRDVRATLVEQLGIEPGPALRELEGAILRQELPLVVEAAPASPRAARADSSVPSWLAPVNNAYVGRTGELGLIFDAWKAVVEGARRLVLIEGEPGIGKTRLVREVAHDLVRRGTVLVGGRCVEEPLHALQPFAEVLGRLVERGGEGVAALSQVDAAALAGLVPELGGRVSDLPAGDAESMRYLLFRAVSGMFSTDWLGAVPVLVLDDLHWAAPPTLQLLAHLLRDDDQDGILVLATVRRTEWNEALERFVGELQRERRVDRCLLEGLASDEVAALMSARGYSAAADVVYRMTEGNPFYVEELVRHVVESGGDLAAEIVPASVRDTIARRLLRLSDPARRILGLASVAGQEFRLDVLAAAAGVDVDAVDDLLEEAAHAGVVFESPGRVGSYSFSHALIRHVLRDGLGAARRARVHGRIGEALERAGGDDTLSELAYHFLAASSDGSDPTRGVAYARRAARLARNSFAYHDGLGLLMAARDAIDASRAAIDPATLCDTLVELADAQHHTGHDRDRAESLERAYTIASELGDATLAGRVVLEGFTGTSQVPALWSQRAADVLAMLDDGDPQRIVLTALLCLPLASEPGERAREMATWAVSRVSELSAHERCEVLTYTCGALTAWRSPEEIVTLIESALAAARESENAPTIVSSLSLLRQGLLSAGELERSDEVGREYEALVREVRTPRFLAGVEQRRAMRALLAGRFVEAEAHAQEAVTLQPTPEFLEGLAVQLFAMRFEQGRLSEVRDAVAAWAAQDVRPAWDLGYAMLLAEIGEFERAHGEMRQFVESRFSTVPRDGLWFTALAVAAHCATLLRDNVASEIAYDLLAPHASRVIVLGEGAVCWGSMHRILGALAASIGHREEALAHFEAAIRLHERLGALPFLARDRLALARLLIESRSDRDRAGDLVRTGLALSRELDLRDVVARNADLLDLL